MWECPLSVSSFDFVFRGAALDSKNFVIIFSFAFLQLKFCMLQQLSVFVIAAVGSEILKKENLFKTKLKLSLKLIICLLKPNEELF